MFSTIGAVDVERFGLLFSVTFIAIVVIGGVGTVMGPIFGSIFFDDITLKIINRGMILLSTF